jgi:hypothetical protein
MGLELIMHDEWGRQAYRNGDTLDMFTDDGSDGFQVFKQGYEDEKKRTEAGTLDAEWPAVSMKIFQS